MSATSSETRIVAEATAPPEGWWAGIRGVARAAHEAGADILLVDPPAELVGAGAEAWTALRKEILRADLDLFVTVRRAEEVALLAPVGVGGWAAPAPAVAASPLGDALGATHLPTLLLADHADDPLDEAAGVLRRYDLEVTLLFGSALRPTPAEASGLDRLGAPLPVSGLRRGFADRSGTGWTALAACALGADLVAIPLALSSYLPGAAGTLDPAAFHRVAEGIRYLAWARAHGGAGGVDG